MSTKINTRKTALSVINYHLNVHKRHSRAIQNKNTLLCAQSQKTVKRVGFLIYDTGKLPSRTRYQTHRFRHALVLYNSTLYLSNINY